MTPQESEPLPDLDDLEVGPEKRRYFRLRYPVLDRPRIIIEGVSHEVIEISEGGARILVRVGQEIPRDCLLTIQVIFTTGDISNAEGRFLRQSGEETVVIFSDRKGIEFKRIFAEQRRILKLYPDHPQGRFGKPGDTFHQEPKG